MLKKVSKADLHPLNTAQEFEYLVMEKYLFHDKELFAPLDIYLELVGKIMIDSGRDYLVGTGLARAYMN